MASAYFVLLYVFTTAAATVVQIYKRFLIEPTGLHALATENVRFFARHQLKLVHAHILRHYYRHTRSVGPIIHLTKFGAFHTPTVNAYGWTTRAAWWPSENYLEAILC